MIRKLLAKLLSPSYDTLIHRANAELHQFQILKYRNPTAAYAHRDIAIKLYRQAEALLRK